VASQLLFADIIFSEEDKCISLLCFIPNSWDNVVVTLGNNVITLNIDDLVASLLSKEMRWKTMDTQTKDALSLRGHLGHRIKSKSSEV
jgi:hypothetical protein